MHNKSSHHDVDLKNVYTSIKSRGVNTSYSIIRFFKKNLIPLLALLIVGFIVGLYADNNIKKYKSTIIVTPNFNTVDYLYERVELLNTKILSEEEDYLTSIGLNDTQDIKEITVEPLSDIYDFVVRDDQNYNVFKTLSENSSANDVLKDFNTSKNFPRHRIVVKSKSKLPMAVLENIMLFLNDNEYYEKIRGVIYNNIQDEIKVNQSVIKQIDNILEDKSIAKQTEGSVYINESNELNQLVNNKISLQEKNYDLKTHLFSLEYIIAPISYFNNMHDESMIVGKLKFIFPLLLVLAFMFFKMIRSIDTRKPDELA